MGRDFQARKRADRLAGCQQGLEPVVCAKCGKLLAKLENPKGLIKCPRCGLMCRFEKSVKKS